MYTPTLAELRDIFYSGSITHSSDMSLLNTLHFYIIHGYVVVEQVTIASKTAYLDCASSLRDDELVDAAGGSRQHIALKILSQTYLKQQGINTVCEQNFAGYFPDVMSEGGQMICECGHTDNADKILEYLVHPTVTTVLQVPYPDDTDTFLYGYQFLRGQDFIAFRNAHMDDESQKIKALINRRKTN